jgi:hypothetical protein
MPPAFARPFRAQALDLILRFLGLLFCITERGFGFDRRETGAVSYLLYGGRISAQKLTADFRYNSF